MRSVFVILAATVALSGCESFKDTFGFSKNPPDEFRVITKAPLVIPPEFSLRPPRQGESAQKIYSTQEMARAALIGTDSVLDIYQPSDGERQFMKKADADTQDGTIRVIIDNENNQTEDAHPSLVEKLTFGLVGGN